MNELEKRPEEIDAATRHMMDLALMKARDIEGTYLADLELALNMIRQYRRSLAMVGAPDPNGKPATDLLEKYSMTKTIARRNDDKERQAREFVTALRELEAVRKQNELAPPPKQIGSKSSYQPGDPLEDEEVVDAEVVDE